MKSTRVMDAVDAEDQPKKPTYALGKVVNRQSNMANGLNHADYVNGDGFYDILR